MATATVGSDQPIKDIEQTHPDEWLVIRVTATDKNGDPSRGELLFHSSSRDEQDRFFFAHWHEALLLSTYSGKPKGIVVLHSGNSL